LIDESGDIARRSRSALWGTTAWARDSSAYTPAPLPRHGFSDERVMEILKSPDAVHHSSGTAGRLVFRRCEDIVVTDGPGNTQGQAITAYGPPGVKGESGAEALGGSPTDPGSPVAHEDIVEGRIPGKNGCMPPAVQIR
jgi:hypothetical protein